MSEKVPECMRKGEYFEFLRSVWRKMDYPYNQHFAQVIYGASGTGKSYVSMAEGEALYPDFDPNESIAFSPEQFTKIVSGKHKKRFPVILDDAGLSAFSGDALNRNVKRISKIAQSIRYKNWAVILNIPDLSLLAKSVRITNHYVSKPMFIDYEKKLNYITFQQLEKAIFGEKLFRRNQVYYKRFSSLNSGYEVVQKCKKAFHPVPLPSKHICKEYENLKNEFMQKFREETYSEIMYEKSSEQKKRARITTKQLAEIIKDKPGEYSQGGELYFPLIMKKFGVSHMSARNAIKIAQA